MFDFRRAVATDVIAFSQDPASMSFFFFPHRAIKTCCRLHTAHLHLRQRRGTPTGCLVKPCVGLASRPLILLRSQLLVQQQTWMSRAASLSAGLMSKVLSTSGVALDRGSLPGTGGVTDRVPLSPAATAARLARCSPLLIGGVAHRSHFIFRLTVTTRRSRFPGRRSPTVNNHIVPSIVHLAFLLIEP